METKIKLEVTNQELEILYRGLLELPSKFSLPVIRLVEAQVKAQEPKEDASTNKENV